MSISDEMMWKYYELLTDLSESEISDLRSRCADGSENPRNAKVALAKLIIADFHSDSDAAAAEEDFNRRFVKKEIHDDIETKTVAAGDHELVQLLADTGLAGSKGEARRLIQQGGVKVNGEKASAGSVKISADGEGLLLQVGKRNFLRITGV
jgi:tyrosyl-tRNA synthetase